MSNRNTKQKCEAIIDIENFLEVLDGLGDYIIDYRFADIIDELIANVEKHKYALITTLIEESEENYGED